MMNSQLLFVCWCSSIFTVTCCITVNGISCVSAYWDTISCVLNITDNHRSPSNTSYTLNFMRRTNTYTCPLVWMNPSYHCTCKVTENTMPIKSIDFFNIKICYESNCQLVWADFCPANNIQLTSPNEVKVQQIPEAFNITWKSGYENNVNLKDNLDYELLIESSTERKTLHYKSRQYELISKSLLKSHDEYCVKVRSFPRDYNGTWSKWSPLTCWTVQTETSISVILTKVLAPLCVVFAVLLFVTYSPAARMKIKTLSHTPSPAPFFQPLFQQHEGNFQDWLSPPTKCAPIYKTEEMLITDVVTVIPKPMTKDPEEKQDYHGPSVNQLVFAQCQTSYVGLPGMDKVSSPITLVCPRDTSYTQLPCSIWGFNTEEIQAASSAPKYPLEISCSDSGCSFESPTESPDCSLPTSPVVDSPPQFYCTDYCILNQTAEGVVPVLVTKGSGPNVTLYPDQENES